MIYWTAFLLGLVGSLHCAGMCGPLTLLLPSKVGNPASFFLGRIFYNFGRMVTYCVLGLGVGLIGKTLLLVGIQRWVSIGLGVILLVSLVASKRHSLQNPAYQLIGRLKSFMSNMLRRKSISSLLVLGLLNGFLPCGLVYIAATGAITTGAVGSSLGYIAAFGAGTFPMMLGISFFGKPMPISFRLRSQHAIPVVVVLLALLLILRGMSLGIPFLSPDLTQPSCCHK